MNILLTGGTGMIGSALQRTLSGHPLWYLMRREPKPGELAGGHAVRNIRDIDTKLDAVINLAGENIGARRWTRARKQALRDSRIEFTQALTRALAAAGQHPAVWINASAVGYYGDQPQVKLSEDAPAGEDFAARLCADWEAAARTAVPLCDRQVIFRLGVVIGAGGALAKLRLPFSLGLGAVMGPGQQFMPWVALEDVCAAIQQALEDTRYSGVINLVAPEAVDQRRFAEQLAQQLGRPLLFKFPAPVLQLLMGEMSRLLLVDQQVLPARLQALGFSFAYPRLAQALQRSLA